MDDDHTLQWEIFVPHRRPAPAAARPCAISRGVEPRGQRPRRRRTCRNGTGWYDRFNIDQNLDNDYLIDREAQRTGKSYTGIPGIRQQDMAVTETHGPDLRPLRTSTSAPPTR